MTCTRLVLGWALNRLKSNGVLIFSIGVSLAGALIINFTDILQITALGMILLGVGLAACFPVIMGYTGTLYSHLSGTAFSFILVLALIGNMLCNYGMGIVASQLGTGRLPVVLAGLLIPQLLILLLVLKRLSKILTFTHKD
jgi:MFS family permease